MSGGLEPRGPYLSYVFCVDMHAVTHPAFVRENLAIRLVGISNDVVTNYSCYLSTFQCFQKRPLLPIVMMEELDETTTCPVCYEAFNTMENIPRIMPCSHTACEKCMKELLREDHGLVCPECRKKHATTNGVVAFPQNKYIFKLLKNNAEVRNFEMCKTHSRELSLYCRGTDCKSQYASCA